MRTFMSDRGEPISCGACVGDGPVLILGAMRSEIGLLQKALVQPMESRWGDIVFTRGRLDGKDTVVCLNRVGAVFASAATALGIEWYHPRMVINCGTAGGHNPDLHTGDLILGETLVNIARIDCPHRDEGQGIDFRSWSNPLKEDKLLDGMHYVPVTHSDPGLLDLAETVEYPMGRVVRGTVLSSDLWNRELDRIRWLYENLGSSCEDMESFAVAKLCQSAELPCLVARVLSNSEWHPEEPKDYDSVGRRCQAFVRSILRRLPPVDS